MKFLLDENFPRTSKALLEDLGHTVYDMRDLLPIGTDDQTVFDKAQELGATLLSTDRDFFHTIPYFRENHAGVIVVALRQPNRSAIQKRLVSFLSKCANVNIDNHVYQIRDTSYIEAPKYPPHTINPNAAKITPFVVQPSDCPPTKEQSTHASPEGYAGQANHEERRTYLSRPLTTDLRESMNRRAFRVGRQMETSCDMVERDVY